MTDKAQLIIDQIKEHLEYAKYDIDPILNRPISMVISDIQYSVKEDLCNISDLINELELLLSNK